MITMILRSLPRIILDTWGGAWKRSPLFDPETKLPITAPRKLSPQVRADLDTS